MTVISSGIRSLGTLPGFETIDIDLIQYHVLNHPSMIFKSTLYYKFTSPPRDFVSLSIVCKAEATTATNCCEEMLKFLLCVEWERNSSAPIKGEGFGCDLGHFQTICTNT